MLGWLDRTSMIFMKTLKKNEKNIFCIFIFRNQNFDFLKFPNMFEIFEIFEILLEISKFRKYIAHYFLKFPDFQQILFFLEISKISNFRFRKNNMKKTFFPKIFCFS